jgi:hypothetical protein
VLSHGKEKSWALTQVKYQNNAGFFQETNEQAGDYSTGLEGGLSVIDQK